MRMGKDILWYHSCVTNNAGMDWLKRYFGAKGIRVHDMQFGTTETVFYAFHIDVIICPIRPGLPMHNPARPFLTEEAMQLFKKNDWEIVEAVRPTLNYDEVLDSFGTPRKGPNPIFMNTLSLGPNTICVEVIPIPYDKVVPLGGPGWRLFRTPGRLSRRCGRVGSSHWPPTPSIRARPRFEMRWRVSNWMSV